MLSDDELQAIRERLEKAERSLWAYEDKGKALGDWMLTSFVDGRALLAEVDRLRAEQRRGWTINDAFLHLALEGSDES